MPKLPTRPKRGLFRKFNLSNCFQLIQPCHAAQSEKNPYSRSRDITLHTDGPQVGQNCPFGPKGFCVSKFNFSDFTSVIVPCHAAKFEQNL